MRTTFTIIAVIGFVSISLFGLVLMPYNSDHAIDCLASLINNSASPCPESDPLGFANFHNNAIKKISTLTVIDGVTAEIVIHRQIHRIRHPDKGGDGDNPEQNLTIEVPPE